MAKANPLKGQAGFGDRLLHMNFEAWIAFEHESKRKITDHLLDLELGLGCDELVNWICAFIDGDISREEAIALISSVGYPETFGALREVVKSFFGPLAETVPENPPQAAQA